MSTKAFNPRIGARKARNEAGTSLLAQLGLVVGGLLVAPDFTDQAIELLTQLLPGPWVVLAPIIIAGAQGAGKFIVDWAKRSLIPRGPAFGAADVDQARRDFETRHR